ncbi:hypothetical protein F5B22DRAFT_648703 [Xylaria bambusicola]|uniref:uncharacterized protein n=1 Tax=Xylaria bambusicola TaxID=326684 RepID=UPI0020082BE0|nr:uncharacterized protein F5B22DRAFT_648703 [Xylaria bambusicola]KAI0509682.1 hypothetical protein F5B22DRAFT_648703 [Xylaria bambusicola]
MDQATSTQNKSQDDVWINIGSDSNCTPYTEFLYAKCLAFEGLSLSKFGFLLIHPTVEKIVLESCSWGDTSTIPSDTSMANAHEIRMYDMDIDGHSIEQIVSTFPRLRSITYQRPYAFEDTNFGGIGYGLVHYGQKIENLDITNEDLRPFSSWFYSLAPMKSLKTLEISLELLIGFHDQPYGDWYEYEGSVFNKVGEAPDYDAVYNGFGDWTFLNKLPRSLESLTIDIEEPKLGVYYNTYERYGAKFEELISSRRFSKLERVIAPGMDKVAERIRDKLPNWVVDRSGCILKRIAPPPPAAEGEESIDDELEIDEENPENYPYDGCQGESWYACDPWKY